MTPDFLIDNKIAVEVRRLNRNYKSKNNGNLISIDAPIVDNITNGMEVQDFEEVKKIPFKKYKFTKVIILSPDGDFRAFKF